MKNIVKKLLRGKEESSNHSGIDKVYAPVDGEIISLKNVNDPVFQDGSMGDGCAIIPTKGVAYAPISGKITTMFPHAIGIIGNDGKEILLHIGINTVDLNGNGFKPYVKKGDDVKVGSKIMEFDLELIKEKGYETDVLVILTNSKEYNGISLEPKSVTRNEILFTVNDKS
ncbi:PTS sugar transporter subunit IIA [Lentibacillus salinarum]|uniref:PTS glucose transporter subunit IIA n=1 Tax=Lentibacillus salinarum TaxID=446820 RepID=A0ABW3ZW19_9BACI